MIPILSSLRARLALVVFLSAAPALSLLYFTGLELKEQAIQEAELQANRIVHLVAQEQINTLAQARQLVETIALLPQVYGQDGANCTALVQRILARHPSAANAGAIALDGKPFCSAIPIEGQRNASSSNWFQRVLRERDYVSSGFHFGGVTHKPVITLAYPSFQPNGQLAAVAFLSLDLSWLNQMASYTALPEGYVLTAIDRRGTVVARVPDPEFWVGENYAETPIITSILKGSENKVLASIGLDGRESLFAYQPLATDSEGTEAYIYIGVPVERAYGKANAILKRNLIGLVIVFMIAIVVASWGSDAIVLQRLRRLIDAARKLASGDLSERTQIPDNDEVGHLAKAFDDMANALEKRAEEGQKSQSALQASRSMLECVLDTIPVRVYWKDRHLNYLGCNNLFARDAGLNTPEDIVGKNDNQLIWSQHAEKYRADDLDVMDSGIAKLSYELAETMADGNEIWLESNKIPLRDENQNVIGILGAYQDITDRKKTEYALNHLAYHDGLTGLVNRREFENRLDSLIGSARDHDTEHALLYIDLDQFKIINDTCGHFAGDELLKQLSSVLLLAVRTHDTVARLGGDEFGIILEDCQATKALDISEKLLNQVQDFRFVWRDATFSVGASIGLVTINESSPNMQELLTYADMACYAAKDRGRNRVHVYVEDDIELRKRHGEMQWVATINDALETGKFRLYYQTIVPLSDPTETTQHWEILLRMQAEDGQIIHPARFIAAAERYSLMPRVDRWVITHTFEWLERNYKQSNEAVQVFINISGTSLGDDAFLQFIRSKLEEIHFPHDRVGFEITETSAIADFSNAEHFIREIKQTGCRVALDDFGAGMSSFFYLRSLPVDYIKIDGSFVHTMLEDHMDMAVVKAINEVGHVARVKTIAEFVESPQVLHALTSIGIDYAQGHQISLPEPLPNTSTEAMRQKR